MRKRYYRDYKVLRMIRMKEDIRRTVKLKKCPNENSML